MSILANRAQICEGLRLNNFEVIWGSACKGDYTCEKVFAVSHTDLRHCLASIIIISLQVSVRILR